MFFFDGRLPHESAGATAKQQFLDNHGPVPGPPGCLSIDSHDCHLCPYACLPYLIGFLRGGPRGGGLGSFGELRLQ